MDYTRLNDEQKRKMNGICHDSIQMEWEDDEALSVFAGHLPEYRRYDETKVEKQALELKKIYDSYDFFNTNESGFLTQLEEAQQAIKKVKPNWYGIDLGAVQTCMRRHKACVMSGEGGIGKSYFLKCLEETLEKEGTKHLCVYGKFEKEINRIDFNEIANLAQRETFVIIIDAINEMHLNAQRELIEKLKEIKPITGVRIIVSYRTFSLDEGIKQQLEAICETQYSFPGISFESALRILEVLPVENLYLYEDILFTQNALFLKMLHSVLHSESPKGEIGRGKLKSITSITYIYEQYIKNTIDVETWRLTKRIADWMFHNNCRRIGIDIVHGLTQDAEAKLAQLREYGFVSYYEYEGIGEVIFTIDSITEYLIGRSAFEYIQREDRKNRIRLIADIVKKMPWLSEAIVLVVFDLLSPDYMTIYTTLLEADLLHFAGYSVLRKVVFQPENIPEFQKVFLPERKEELLTFFGGYGGKPFNCENYLNDYFIENKKGTKKELTSLLSDPYHSHEIRGRLKNILYMIYLQDVDQHMLAEASSFAMWCCASPNEGIRCIAMKLLYETMRLSEGLQKRAIECFADIEDHYIRESIVCALSFASTDGTKPIVDAFFEQLIDDPCFVSEKSLKYIEEYYGVQEAYIHWGKKDYYADGSERKISKEMDEMLWRIDLHDNAILPFRYDFHSITLHTRFLAVNKKELAAINSEIQAEGMKYKDEKCQDCYLLGEYLKTKHSVDSKLIENKRYMCTFEDIARTVFKEYGVPFKANVPVDYKGSRNTSFMKCIMIVIDIMNGSLMCNYYTDSFEFEEKQPLARGYQEHNPFRYGRSINVASPLPTYNNRIEDMSEMVLNRQDRPKIKDFAWVRDVEITKNNLLVLQQPIEYEGTEWILLACRISVRESNKHETAWVDTYDYWCCTNEEERIMGINEDRYLTIELREYDRPADRYYLCNSKPWLCKSVPAIGKEEFFDEHSLVFPPAEMINQLGLTLNHRKMSWINKDGEEIILCNNSRNSYYHDPIGSTIFMRKDCYEQYAEEHNLKFFAFTEKYIPETGYAPETSLHYELEKGKIVKIFKNDSSSFSEECRTCQYGLKSGRQEGEPFMTKYMQLIDKLGYRTRDEDFDEL